MEPSYGHSNELTQTAADDGYQIVPCWIDTTGRTRTWTLLSPNGDRIADVTTKHGARNLLYLLSNPDQVTWGRATVCASLPAARDFAP